MTTSNFRDLVAWQKAMSLAKKLHETTKMFPKCELFGITQQLRSAAVSVPSNIAEGRGRGSAREYRHFLLTARGSLYEVETQVLLSREFGYLQESVCEELIRAADEVVRIINGLIRYLDGK